MDPVETYYENYAQAEWDRLGRYRMEFEITKRAIGEVIPPPPAKVLDLGGGPGRYSLWLASLGYEVVLGDISQASLDLANAKANELGQAITTLKLDARDLSRFEDHCFDAVLMLGPMYHLVTPEERLTAMRESSRVLRPGRTHASAFLGRYAFLIYEAAFIPEGLADRMDMHRSILDEGIHDPAIRGHGFTRVYATHPDEIPELVSSVGLSLERLISCESIARNCDDRIKDLGSEDWNALFDLAYEVCDDPTLLGSASHLLAISRKA